MPTVPPEPPSSSAAARPRPHEHRQVAESFGVDAERYDRARPRYPDEVLRRVVAGCGTGIEARQLRAAGCRVLAVEPDGRMADVARRHGVDVEVATFEAWDPAGRTFDAVVAGTAWHWVDPVAGAAKAAQVLRPGGRLAALWNVFDPPPAVSSAFADAYRRVAPDSPFDLQAAKDPVAAYDALLTMAADGMRQAGAFGEPERWRDDWQRPFTRDEWLDQLPTHGTMTRLPPDAAAEVLDAVGAAIDAIGGGFTMSYTTLTITATRTNAA